MSGGSELKTRGSEARQNGSPKAAAEAQEESNLERRPSEKLASRGRKGSLRRAKNSTDMLRARSLQRQQAKQDVAPDGNSGGREGKGRQFTVANVGNNGMIYLRFV